MSRAKRRRPTRRIGLAASLVVLIGCAAPGTHHRPTTIADSAFLEEYARTRRFSLGRPRAIKIVPDGSAVLFLRSKAADPVQDLWEFDTASGQERLLLTAEQILKGAAEHLSVKERARRERMRLTASGIASYVLSKDGDRILVPLSGRLFVVNRTDGQVTELKSEHGYPIDPKFSPNGQLVSCVRDGVLYVMDIATGEEWAQTPGSGENVTHALAEFVAQEEMGRRSGYWWSPDSKTIAYQRTDTTGMEVMHIMDATHPERPPQTWPYPRPGKKNADVTLGLIPVDGGYTTWINWDRKRYPYLATVKWNERAPLTILVQNRRQTEQALLSVDRETGQTSTLLIESDDAWLNLDQSMPHWFVDGSAFLWTTERNGAWQLELRDPAGPLIGPLTEVGFGYRGFVHLFDTIDVVCVLGSDDPMQTHVYSVNFESDAPRRFSDEPGVHAVSFARNASVYVDTVDTLDGERAQIVHSAKIGRLRSVGPKPPFIPNIELTTVGRDPEFHAVLIRPRDFDSTRRYPVIVYVYGGPEHQTVQASPSRYLIQQWMADQGFIVVAFDVRGTPSRGRAWERITKNNLIDVPLDDQAAALKALGERYPELDLRRVGIYGWSFGGYFSAMAAMRRPDVYHAAVAGAPVADWQDYDTHYTERYLGLPQENADGYRKSSVLTYAKDLSVPLLIIHGTADDNVYFTHSLKMSDALFRAGKEHDFLVLTGFTHMVHDPLVTTRLYTRIISFFQEHLRED
ncbi:MAG: alpha/beta fold hydrolase [Phycisphaerae bacterium]